MTLFDDLLSVVRSLIRSEDPNEKKLLESGPVAGLLDTFNRSELGDMALLLIERRRDAKSGLDPVFALELAVLAMSGSMLPSATTATATPLRVILSEAPAKPGEAEGQFSNKIKTGKLSPSASSGQALGSGPSNGPTLGMTSDGPLDLSTVQMKWTQIVAAVLKENRALPFILKIFPP